MAITGKRKRNIILIAVAIPVILLGWGLLRGRGDDGVVSSASASTFKVARGDLVMSITESGTIKARNALEIESKVEGNSVIVALVPEGSYITEEDVANGRVLVELDSSELRDRKNQQQITFNSAEADYTEAKESLIIQKNQNDSDVQQGLMNLKFARMDFQKYLGEKMADMLIAEYKATGQAPTTGALLNDPNALGGASLQQLREYESDIDLAKEEYTRAETDLGWTQKLYDKDYVAKSDLESDQLKVKRLKVNWTRANTTLALFLQYDFPKEAEKLFSDYQEAERELERVYAQTRSRLAQAEARLSSSEAKYLLNKEQLERIERQIEACTMRATETGMVIYASSNRRWGGSRTNIEVGEDVRERELIMTITNADEMDVDVKVHETNVDKVREGQPVRVVIDAQPDKVFSGKVLKIAPLPDPQSVFGNPDLKVYSTDVSLEGVGNSIKPGMSARVEILIAQLDDVLSIPIQSVANRGGRKVCYTMNSGKSEECVIQTGAFNDRFVQVLDGIEEGQEVLLNPPRLMMTGDKQVADSSSGQWNVEPEAQPAGQPAPVEGIPGERPGPAAAGPGGPSDRLKQMDTNGDGKISLADETPEQARQFIARLDTDKDGFIDKKEMDAAAAAAPRMAPGGGPGGAPRGPGQRERQP